MIKLYTNYPVAIDSDDHKYPEGVYYDNNVSIKFIEELENYFTNKRIKLLDLGCAGGELICKMVERGHTECVGLEGSDHIINVRENMVEEVGFLPLGYDNWKKFYNKNLFTCDVTKEYDIKLNDERLEFDIITSWDVMEHFNPDEVNSFLEQTYKHLKIGGLFIAQIALYSSYRHPESKETPENLDYHKSVFPKEWWIEKINKFYKPIENPLTCGNRDHTYGYILHLDQYLVYVGIK